MLADLAKAGIQNGRRVRRLRFETVQPYAGQYIRSIAVEASMDGAAGRAKPNGAVDSEWETARDNVIPVDAAPALRIGVAIGRQYGIVAQEVARDAAREAFTAGDVDLLCILAFAFEPTVVEISEAGGVPADVSCGGLAGVAGERALGKVRLFFVQLNVDLLMSDALEKTGGGDPHMRLKTARKAEIEANTWASLYFTAIRPFASPETGQIAIKVINDYGDNAMNICEAATQG